MRNTLETKLGIFFLFTLIVAVRAARALLPVLLLYIAKVIIDALSHRNRYGLLSEDVDPQTGALWGNFPQTYSMAGLILTAMRLSRSWEDRYWRRS